MRTKVGNNRRKTIWMRLEMEDRWNDVGRYDNDDDGCVD